MSRISTNKEYKTFLAGIKEKVYRSQYEAMKQVNKGLINLYWEIGESIVEKQQKHKWGKSVVEKLSLDLQKEFAGMQGWSVANLWRMRKFYLTYKDDKKVAPLVREIAWSHNMLIFERIKSPVVRHFYTARQMLIICL